MQDSGGKDRLFTTTQWSLVLTAADTADPLSREALATLCRAYWYPVYALIRHLGNDRDASQDLAQGFFVHVLEKGTLKIADPNRGRFRSFLKAVLRSYLDHERHRATAQKRGGGRPVLSLDLDTAEDRYSSEPFHRETPEDAFEKRWAQTVLTRALDRLGEEMQDDTGRDRFRILKPYLTGDDRGRSYARIADDLDMTEGAVKAAVLRMRKRYGQLLKEEVAHTVAAPEDVDAEIRYLFSVAVS